MYGASHVIVTSYVFSDGRVNQGRLQKLVQAVGKENLVLDLSCRRKGDDYFIVTDRWQKFTDVLISPGLLDQFASLCDKFLIHAVDVEGQCNGIEMELVKRLAGWSPILTTYAGGIKDINDMESISNLGRDRLHATVGSALDIFGGTGMIYEEAVAFHRIHE